jgi:hypothetical protein
MLRIDTGKFEEVMRLTFGPISILAWLLLAVLAASGANMLTNE